MKFIKITLSLSGLTLLLSAILFLNSCKTQKAATTNETVESTEEVPEEPIITVNERGCEKFAGDEKKAKIAFSLFHEDVAAGLYDNALPNWEYVFENTPGLTEFTFIDGEKIFKKKLDEATDPTEKKQHFDRLMEVYDQRAICYGKSAHLSGKKAFAFDKYYPEEEDIIFDFAEKSVLNGGNDAKASQLQIYWRYLIKRLKKQQINKDELTEAYDTISQVISYNLENGNAETISQYSKAQDEIQSGYDSLIEALTPETITITNCQEVVDYMQPKYLENPNDLNVVKRFFGGFLKFKCYTNPLFKEVTEKYNELEPKASTSKILGNIARKNKNYDQALSYYQTAFSSETDNAKKAKIKMTMANMVAYETGKKDFTNARKHAREAADLNPNWGEPYILIGRMYAASGKLCGPGTGFESQKVLWPAMDMWNKAKRTDPASADLAQKYINEYYQYMPTMKDLFQRGISVGDDYSIGCWIGGTVKARAK